MPVRVVAVNHDTSIPMIERTYSQYIGDHADALARKVLLEIGGAAKRERGPNHSGEVIGNQASMRDE